LKTETVNVSVLVLPNGKPVYIRGETGAEVVRWVDQAVENYKIGLSAEERSEHELAGVAFGVVEITMLKRDHDNLFVAEIGKLHEDDGR